MLLTGPNGASFEAQYHQHQEDGNCLLIANKKNWRGERWALFPSLELLQCIYARHICYAFCGFSTGTTCDGLSRSYALQCNRNSCDRKWMDMAVGNESNCLKEQSLMKGLVEMLFGARNSDFVRKFYFQGFCKKSWGTRTVCCHIGSKQSLLFGMQISETISESANFLTF